MMSALCVVFFGLMCLGLHSTGPIVVVSELVSNSWVFLSISLEWDNASGVFGMILCAVAFVAYKYSTDYMGEFNGAVGFYLALTVFTTSMLLLIFASDLLTVFIAWDGLGVSSFLLVCFFDKTSSMGGGALTFITNRFGDAFLVIGVATGLCGNQWALGGVFFVMAAFSKSAQWPLCSWLPAAMAAPTPISALVHSSTLVTAGVYLLIRTEVIHGASRIIPWGQGVGACTFLLAAIGACLTYDLKRLIAMSTLGHLGFMVTVFMVGASNACIYHLWVHALFKSVLFMVAGNFIQACGHSQDIRDMGGISVVCPHAALCGWVSIWSLGGMPVSCCFYSKAIGCDLIFAAAPLCGCVIWLALIATCFYCVRLLKFIGGSSPRHSTTALDVRGGGLYVGWLVAMTFCACWFMSMLYSSMSGAVGSSSSWEGCFLSLGIAAGMGTAAGLTMDFSCGHFTGLMGVHRLTSSKMQILVCNYINLWEMGKMEGATSQYASSDLQSPFMLQLEW